MTDPQPKLDPGATHLLASPVSSGPSRRTPPVPGFVSWERTPTPKRSSQASTQTTWMPQQLVVRDAEAPWARVAESAVVAGATVATVSVLVLGGCVVCTTFAASLAFWATAF